MKWTIVKVHYSLHRNGRDGWVMVWDGKEAEVYGPVLFDRAKTVYNSLLAR